MELEVTFVPALDELSQRLAAKKKEKVDSRNDTVWEAYLRRRRCTVHAFIVARHLRACHLLSLTYWHLLTGFCLVLTI